MSYRLTPANGRVVLSIVTWGGEAPKVTKSREAPPSPRRQRRAAMQACELRLALAGRTTLFACRRPLSPCPAWRRAAVHAPCSSNRRRSRLPRWQARACAQTQGGVLRPSLRHSSARASGRDVAPATLARTARSRRGEGRTVARRCSAPALAAYCTALYLRASAMCH